MSVMCIECGHNEATSGEDQMFCNICHWRRQGEELEIRETTATTLETELRARIIELERQLEAIPKWRPFETVPRDGRTVLLVMPTGYRNRVAVGYFYIMHNGTPSGVIDGEFQYRRPTPELWMDMPVPPETKP